MSNQRALSRLSAAVLAVGLGALLLLGPLTSPASAATPEPGFDSTFATLLNGLRTSLGIGGLTVDGDLSAIARRWSDHMATTGVMAHNPDNHIQVQGWSKLAENVGYGPGVTQIFNGLVGSPGHLRNMSSPEYTRVGIGTVTDPRGRVWTTHVFVRPIGGAAAPAPRPAAAPATTKKPAPPASRVPRAAPPTAPAKPPATTAPVTAAPAPAAATVPTTMVPATAPAPIEVAGTAAPTETQLLAAPAAARTSSEDDVPLPAVAALLGILLILGALGVSRSRREAREAECDATIGPDDDLAGVMDLRRR